MNNRGQLVIYSFMLGIIILILALALAPPVKEFVDNSRNETDGDLVGMDCSNESISSFQKAGCLATDLTLFYFIGTLVFMAGAIMGARVLLGGSE